LLSCVAGARFGAERAVDLMPHVFAIREDFSSSSAHQTAGGLVEMTNQAAGEFRERHPEISDKAVNALAWCYSYDCR
jgi:hypothetical protein